MNSTFVTVAFVSSYVVQILGINPAYIDTRDIPKMPFLTCLLSHEAGDPNPMVMASDPNANMPYELAAKLLEENPNAVVPDRIWNDPYHEYWIKMQRLNEDYETHMRDFNTCVEFAKHYDNDKGKE